MCLCFHKNCENSKYIIKRSQHVIQRNVAPAHAQHFRVNNKFMNTNYLSLSHRNRLSMCSESGKPSQISGIRARNPIIRANGSGFRCYISSYRTTELDSLPFILSNGSLDNWKENVLKYFQRIKTFNESATN